MFNFKIEVFFQDQVQYVEICLFVVFHPFCYPDAGQKPVMLERYFAYSRLHNSIEEYVEILNLYGDRLSKNDKRDN